MIFVSGATLAFFFAFLLAVKKPRATSDNILAFWMLIIGIHLFLYYLHTINYDYKYPHLLGVGIPFPFIHGPLLFLYTGSLTGYFPKWKVAYFLHFLPVVIFYGYYFNFFISTGEEKIEFVNRMFENPDAFYLFVYPFILLSGFSYIFLTFLLFRKHRRNILNNLSNSNEKNNLHWLRNLLIGLLVIWIVVLTGNSIFDSTWADTEWRRKNFSVMRIFLYPSWPGN